MPEWKIEDVREVIVVEGRPLFPISWLHKQEYCEYQISLEMMQGVEVGPTPEMVEGKEEHERLYSEFEKVAVPSTLRRTLEISRITPAASREVSIRSLKHGIYGRIDEIQFTPGAFVVIDDKPGTKAFLSDIHQTYGYCLAFKETVESLDRRSIFAALRERGSNNIYWKSPFDKAAQNEVIKVVDRVHQLISGQEQFASNKNPNKCRSCRFRLVCDRSVV